MNRLLRIMLLAVIILAGATAAEARMPRRDKDSQPKPDRTELARKQAERIADQLALPEETADRFIRTYIRCEQEKWALGNAPEKPRTRITDEQTDSLLRARFDHSRKLLDLREKYYKEYRKFLTAKQVDRVYQSERMQNVKIRGRQAAKRSAAKSR
ncbi:MAG: hypothetical protein NC406_01020 [Bacteroides sp.]|nr:hypothetical protein [Bacteroides sp.]MCM1095325.1 hypothetical protein [Terasakiella sp.]